MERGPIPFRRSATRRCQRGAALLEVSLGLLIVGVLTVATFELQSAMRKRQMNKDMGHVLQSVDAAVRMFVVRQKRLPCPDAAGTGVETGGNAGCGVLTGGVPFVSLGLDLPPLPGGKVLRYGVSGAMFSAADTPLLVRARLASLGAGAGPYVAAPDASRRFTSCGSAALHPAYALMWMPSGTPVSDPNCFHESRDGEMGVLAVGRVEFLGWLQTALGR